MFNELFWMAAADAAQGTAETDTLSYGQTAILVVLFIGFIVYLCIRKKLPEMKLVKQAEKKYGKFSVKMKKLGHYGGLELPTGVDCTAYCGASTFLVTYGTQQFSIPTERLLNVDIRVDSETESQWVNTSFRKYFNSVRRMTTTYTTYYMIISYRKKSGVIDHIFLNSIKDKELRKFVDACKPYCNQTTIDTEL